jgi:arylsulfatase A-like enzyme
MSPGFRRISIAALLAAFALGLASPLASANRNILFIAIDDMRVAPQAVTPNLDSLATQSTVYTNAYTTALWCLPSRTSVMFGLSPATHQVGVANEWPDYDGPPYTDIYDNPSIKSLPEILSAAGYTTAVTGKVFHEPEPSKWDVSGPHIEWNTFYNPFNPTPDGTYLPSGPLEEGMAHPDQAIADWAEQFIQSSNGPFFLAVGFFQPHLPWIAPQWAYDLYPSVTPHVPVTGDLSDEPVIAQLYAADPIWWGQTTHNLVAAAGAAEEKTRAYLAAITHTDARIGQVLTALQNSVHAGNTDIVLWSDHGFHLGEKFHWRKRTYWQPTVQVPLIIKSPALASGTVSSAVSLLDLAPTVLDLANVAPDPQFEGVSLLTGSSPVEIYDRNGKATVTGNIKTVDYIMAFPGDFDIAQYDLSADPDELTNLTPPPGC